MRNKTILLIMIAATHLAPSAAAQSVEAVVAFPRATAIIPGAQVAVLLGRPLGVVPDLVDCGSTPGGQQIFDAVLLRPNRHGSTQSNLIVTEASGILAPGMRLTNFEAIGTCIGPDGAVYDRYIVVVESGVSEPTPFPIDFITPPDARVSSGTGADVGIVLGRPLGTVAEAGLGDCDDHGSFPLHNIVFTRAGAGIGSDIVAVIVTAGDEPISPGTRLEGIEMLGFCTVADGAVYSKYRATARPIAAKQ